MSYKTYTVQVRFEVQQTFRTTLQIRARSAEEAERKAEKLHDDCKIEYGEPSELPELNVRATEAKAKLFEIWSEGYRATGEAGPAYKCGTAYGMSFAEACAAFAKTNAEFAHNFDPVSLTHWGCKLFPTEAEARKSYG